jgi:recombination-promoting nuclease RpnB
MTLIHHPHDHLFRLSLKEHQVALDFFKAHLPQRIYDQIDWLHLKNDTVALMELMLKYARMRDFIEVARNLAKLGVIQSTLSQTTDGYLEAVLNYLFRAGGNPDQSAESLLQVFLDTLPEKERVIMNFAEQLEQKGVEKGLQAGLLQGKYLIAKNMLDEGLSVDLIKKVTGLSELELMTLEEVEC